MARVVRSESGNTTFVVAGVLVALALLFVASLAVARAAIGVSRAQSGADAVALAGAGGDRADADRVASAPESKVVAYRESDSAVEVTVQLIGSDQRASARAERGDTARPVTLEMWVPVTTTTKTTKTTKTMKTMNS